MKMKYEEVQKPKVTSVDQVTSFFALYEKRVIILGCLVYFDLGFSQVLWVLMRQSLA